MAKRIEIELPTRYSKLTSKKRLEVRLEYIKRQLNKCLYCDSSLSEKPPKWVLDKKIHLELYPKGFLKYPVHLQHNHNTDMTEGAVHSRCNAILFEYHGR